ncbi:efflux RND transporter permease subunit, partial [Pseudomonas aeruginosa]|uniref:efflux RND transporter permease subunit n=1 Tax=Pseudomonas aeruginosa TaxID=287 RepID=UPI003CC5616B
MWQHHATLDAAPRRRRPIVKSSVAFGFGVDPLALSRGAGSGAQDAIGTGVLGANVTASVLALFLEPLFLLVVGRLIRLRKA